MFNRYDLNNEVNGKSQFVNSSTSQHQNIAEKGRVHQRMKSSFGYNPCLDADDVTTKMNNPYAQVVNIPTQQITEKGSFKQSEYWSTIRTLKEDINYYASDSRDYGIIHHEVESKKASTPPEGYGVISSLNTSFNKKCDSMERPISGEPFAEVDVNKIMETSSVHGKISSEAHSESTHDKDSEGSVKNLMSSCDQTEGSENVCTCCKTCKADKVVAKKLIKTRKIFVTQGNLSLKQL